MLFTKDLERNLRSARTAATTCADRAPSGSTTRSTADERLHQIELPQVAAGPAEVPRQQALRRPAEGGARPRPAQNDAIWSRTARSRAPRGGRGHGFRASWAARMGAAVGEALVAAARLAVLQEAPLIVFTASGGARMQEGTISLMQMPRTTIAARLVKEAGLPYIVVLTDPTTGGVTASFAMLGDIQIAEPGALIGFAGAAGDRGDDPREAAGRLPARRIPATSTAWSTWSCKRGEMRDDPGAADRPAARRTAPRRTQRAPPRDGTDPRPATSSGDRRAAARAASAADRPQPRAGCSALLARWAIPSGACRR